MASGDNNLRLGDLLIGAEVLKNEELREAIYIAKSQGLPIGKVLIMSGYLSEILLQSAIQAQSLIKDGLVSRGLGLQALQLVSNSALDFEEALRQLGWQRRDGQQNKLGELLFDAGLINQEQLDNALMQTTATGLPLGRVLVTMRVITEQLLASALIAQVLIRDKKVNREQAIHGLLAAQTRQISLEQSLAEIGHLPAPLKPSVRLGELLVLAGLIDEHKLINAVELGLMREQRLGKTLLDLDLITEAILDKALEAQALVSSGVSIDNAANILTTAVTKNLPVARAASLLYGGRKLGERDASPELPLYQFLQLAGLLTTEELERTIRISSQNTQVMALMLRKAGTLEDFVIDAAITCAELVHKKVLRTEQAIIALNHCQRTRSSIYESFDEFGWARPADLRRQGQVTLELEGQHTTEGEKKLKEAQDAALSAAQPEASSLNTVINAATSAPGGLTTNPSKPEANPAATADPADPAAPATDSSLATTLNSRSAAARLLEQLGNSADSEREAEERNTQQQPELRRSLKDLVP